MDNYELYQLIVRSEIRLFNVLQARMKAEHGLAVGQYDFLRLVDRVDGCRVGDIAEAMVVSVGATSRGVDRMEEAGLLQRVPNPANRRSSILELTDAGREKLTQAEVTAQAELAGWFEAAPGRNQLASSLKKILKALEAAGAGKPTG